MCQVKITLHDKNVISCTEGLSEGFKLDENSSLLEKVQPSSQPIALGSVFSCVPGSICPTLEMQEAVKKPSLTSGSENMLDQLWRLCTDAWFSV